jgi:hypothetical protein
MNAALAALRPMNWRAYFALVRFRSLIFLAVIYGFNAITLPPAFIAMRHAAAGENLVAAMGKSVFVTSAKWTGDLIFARMAIFVPIVFGMVLVSIVRVPLRWPTTSLLPGARLSLLRCHSAAVAIAALACATAGHVLDPATPGLAILGFAAVGLALPLPVGNTSRGAKQYYILVATAAMLLALWFAPELRTAAQAAPALVFGAGIAIAVLLFRRGFSREWLRANADSRFMPRNNGVLGEIAANQQAMQKEAWRAGAGVGRNWWRRAVGDSTLAWLEVLLFERFGAVRPRRLAIGFVWGIGFVSVANFFVARAMVGPEVAKIDAASAIYYLICDPSKLPPAFSFMAGSTAVLMFSLGTIFVALPRAGHLYTISRVMRGRAAYLSSVANTVGLLAVVVAGLLLIAWIAALIAGIHFSPQGTPRMLLGMVGTLPLLPLWQWYAFAELTPRPGLVKCAAAAGLFASLALGAFAAISPEALFSPARLPLLVLAVLVAQLAHYAAVQRLFRTGDFAAAR